VGEYYIAIVSTMMRDTQQGNPGTGWIISCTNGRPYWHKFMESVVRCQKPGKSEIALEVDETELDTVW